MKLDLTQEDLNELEKMKAWDPVLRYFNNKNKVKFNIGDILIKKTKNPWNTEAPWHVETIHNRSGLPRRYVYVHEDEHGVGYLKRLKVTDGKLGQELITTTNIDYDNVIFEVDPLYLESIMLGDGTFDIKALQRVENKRKQDIEEFNVKICEHLKTLHDINEWLKVRPMGETFYIDYGREDEYLCMNLRNFEVTAVEEVSIKDWRQSWHFRAENSNHNSDKVVLITDIHGNQYHSFEFIGRNLYATKPLGLFDGIR